MRVTGKTVLVAGGSTGIGLGCALAFARRGAAVIVILARRAERLEKAAQAIRAASAHAVILALAVDLRNPESVRRAGEVIRQKHGVPHILCTSCGAGNLYSVEESPHEDFYLHFQSTVFTAFNLVKEFLPDMIAARSGHVVLAGGSPVSRMPFPAAGYKASRAALRALAESLREDLHDTPVRVTLCEPTGISEGSSYFTDNPESAQRLPCAALAALPAAKLLWSTAERTGVDIVNAVEWDRDFYSPLSMRLATWVAESCLTRALYRLALRLTSLPHAEGGPLAGSRRALWSRLYERRGGGGGGGGGGGAQSVLSTVSEMGSVASAGTAREPDRNGPGSEIKEGVDRFGTAQAQRRRFITGSYRR